MKNHIRNRTFSIIGIISSFSFFSICIAYSHLNENCKNPSVVADVFAFVFLGSTILSIIFCVKFNKKIKKIRLKQEAEKKAKEEEERKKAELKAIEDAKKDLARKKAQAKKLLSKSPKLIKDKQLTQYLDLIIQNVEKGEFSYEYNEIFHDNYFKNLDYDIYFILLIELILKKYGKYKKKLSKEFFNNKDKWISDLTIITKKRIENINNYGLPPNKFLETLKRSETITGCYKIYNASKNMYYVGQAQNIYRRVHEHFNGEGNADVYADYKYGDNFYVNYYLLKNSQFNSLDAMESYFINKFNCVNHGYNRKSGNRYR